MSHWKKLYISPDDTIKTAIAALDTTATHICLVVDEHEILLGTVTDGDIRRGILHSVPLDAPISMVMKPVPIVGHPDHSPDAIKQLMISRHIRQLPIVDLHGRVVGLSLLDDMIRAQGAPGRDTPVILMAGGFGTRLQPLTNDTPKPLLHVGRKPILERILDTLINFDFRNFHITINYKAEMLREHFGDGSRWGVSISYLEEDEPLGTAGSLSLFEERTNGPILVMNGDVLTAVNFNNLMDFHAEQSALATMCVRNYEFQVPYGVVNTDNMNIVSIDEKPSHNFFVNAGIYVLEPAALDVIPKDVAFDMTDLFERLIEQKSATTVFPIREYWLDVGRMDDFKLANNQFDS